LSEILLFKKMAPAKHSHYLLRYLRTHADIYYLTTLGLITYHAFEMHKKEEVLKDLLFFMCLKIITLMLGY